MASDSDPLHHLRVGARGLLLASLSRFYAHRGNMKAVLPYIDGSSNVSLRTIDWFVTNYAKKHSIFLQPGDGSHFNVYVSYRAQLKAYSKQQFDPFRRRDRIRFYYDRDDSVETTIGQLNFFRWMLTNNVLNYVQQHLQNIENDMLTAANSSSNSSNSDAMPATATATATAHVTNAAKTAGDGGGGKQVMKGDVGSGGGGGRRRKQRSELSQCQATPLITRLPGLRTVSFA